MALCAGEGPRIIEMKNNTYAKRRSTARFEYDEADRERLSNIVVAAALIVFCLLLIIGYVIRTHVTQVDTSGYTGRLDKVEDINSVLLFKNTRVGDVDVSGLSVAEAKAKVQEHLDSIFDTPFSVMVAQDKKVQVSLRELSAYWVNPEAIEEAAHTRDGRDVVARYTLDKDMEQAGMDIALEVSLDKEAAISWIEKNCSIYDAEMTGSELVTEGGVKKVKLGRIGQTLNTAESASQLMSRGYDFVRSGESVFVLPLEELYPPSVPEGYEDYPGIMDLVMEAEAEAAAAAAEDGQP